MPTILRNATPAQLNASVEDNLFALFRMMVDELGGELVSDQYGSRHFSYPNSPFFRGVWATQLDERNADAAIDDAITWFRGHDDASFFWWNVRSSVPPDMGERLLAHGFTPYGGNTQEYLATRNLDVLGAPCMVANLHQMDEAALTHVPTDFTIDIVQTERDLDDFQQVFMASYNVPKPVTQAWADAAMDIGLENAPWTIYIGRLAGEPCAMNVLFKGGGVAGLYAVGTSPAMRGRGLGAAITLKPLLDARAQGYDYGVLFASKMGLPVYERLGFYQTNTRFGRFMYTF